MTGRGPRRIAELRRPAFLALTVGFILFLYLFSPFSSLFLGWFVDFEDNISHRVHEVTFGMLFAMMLVGVAAQLRKPEDNVAGLQQAILVAVLLGVVVALSTGWEWTALLYAGPVLAIAAVHPSRRSVLSLPGAPRGGLLYLALLGGLPLLIGFTEEFEKAVNEVRGHQAHWGGMAAFALALVVLLLLAASRPPGWRLTGWSVGCASVVYGAASISFPFDASARPDLRAVLAVIWGVLMLVVTERAVRRERAGDPSPAAADAAEIRGPLVLRRARDGRLVGGVARGVARRYGLPVAALRALALLPGIGAIAYVSGWWLIPIEQDGDRVAPSPHRRPHRGLWLAAVAPATAVTILFGMSLYRLADGLSAPPVPHDIASTAPATCLECHTTGVGSAPIIDPYTHNFHDEFRRRRSFIPRCSDCHRLPTPTPPAAPAQDDHIQGAAATTAAKTNSAEGISRDLLGLLRRVQDRPPAVSP